MDVDPELMSRSSPLTPDNDSQPPPLTSVHPHFLSPPATGPYDGDQQLGTEKESTPSDGHVIQKIDVLPESPVLQSVRLREPRLRTHDQKKGADNQAFENGIHHSEVIVSESGIGTMTGVCQKPDATRSFDYNAESGGASSQMSRENGVCYVEAADYESSDDDMSLVDELLDQQLGQRAAGAADGEPPAKKSKPGDGVKELKDPEHVVTKKIVLRKRAEDYFEVLPEGWIEVTHFSGMPLYLHKASRVCSLSKPYFLGPGSVRKHEIPISAIPCMQYRTQLAKEREALIDPLPGHGSDPQTKKMNVRVESVEESKRKNSLHFLKVREYCAQLFEFQEITIRKFKTWADRRAHTAIKKIKERPSLPEGTKLITCPINNWTADGSAGGNGPESSSKSNSVIRNAKREFVMNPKGKSFVCILHEFIQHSERVQPQYVFQELENAATPYSATVVISGTKYGIGYGTSKKIAKSEAARKTLEILIPAFASQSDGEKVIDSSLESPAESSLSQEMQFFDEISIKDIRVADLCSKAGQFSPYQVLVECLKRNHGLGDTDIKFSVEAQKGNKLKNRFTMTAGKHTASGSCKNKIDGKQIASQEILAKLHPQIQSWGSLLRLYGRGSCKTPKEKKEEEQKITELQSTACANKPNYAILDKLRSEMEKLHAEKERSKSGSAGSDHWSDSSNLRNVNL